MKIAFILGGVFGGSGAGGIVVVVVVVVVVTGGGDGTVGDTGAFELPQPAAINIAVNDAIPIA